VEEVIATCLEYLLGGIITLIEYMGAPTYAYTSCNVWVSHIGFLCARLEGEDISIPNLTLVTPKYD
jgi:hypothetical protein